jgi:hypothetical protein
VRNAGIHVSEQPINKPSSIKLIYPANDRVPRTRLMSEKSAIVKISDRFQVTNAKIMLFEEYVKLTGNYRATMSPKRVVWVLTAVAKGELRMSRGRSICKANAKVVELIDAQTGASPFGRSIHCPADQEVNYFPFP